MHNSLLREAVVAVQDGCGDSAHSRAWDTCSCPLSCFLLDLCLHLSENKEQPGERLWRTLFARSVSSQLLSPLVCQALTEGILGSSLAFSGCPMALEPLEDTQAAGAGGGSE